MGPAPFAYEAPQTVTEAVDTLGRLGERARALAGGQSLVPMMSLHLVRPQVIVDINALPLGGIQHEGSYLRLGALTRYHTLEEASAIAERCPLLAEAAALIGNIRVRTLGTLGGSLAHADPAAELPMTALALDAQIEIVSSDGARQVEAREFFRGPFETALTPGELISAVRVPVRQTHEGWAVEEFSRRAGDFAIVAVAVRLRCDGNGVVEFARVAVAGVALTPVRAEAVERHLVGRFLDAEALAASAGQVVLAIEPSSDIHASAAYRRHLAVVLVRRALARAMARARQEGVS